MVDKSILSVPRPCNTIVDDNGGSGLYRYAVRERAPSRNGKRGPANGKTIGHIINGEFVPNTAVPTGAEGPSSLSYGASAFVWSQCQDLRKLLLEIYPAADALRILAIACIYAMFPHVANNRIGTEYRRTFMNVFLPGLKLSANTIGTLIENVGIDETKRLEFIKRRIEAVCEFEHIAIDGTLKQDTSTVNSFSAFSYKGRVKGCKDISILYAYSIEKSEPLCAQVFPGNCIDAAAYNRFITENRISCGLLIADKGFPVSAIRKTLEQRPRLHFLSPLRRNDKRIAAYNMTSFNTPLKEIGCAIMGRKERMENGSFLYSFQDIRRSCIEHSSYITNAQKARSFDEAAYNLKKPMFGTIVFESDQDLDLDTVYACYDRRWELECLFDMYKHDLDLTTTRVQNEFSIIGQEFINLIATIITSRCVRKARAAEILKSCTYGNLLTDLDRIWRKTDAPANPMREDGCWTVTFNETMNKMVALGLCGEAPKYEVQAPGKRGRRKKSDDVQSVKTKRKPGRPKTRPEFVGPKRPRGRPRKIKTNGISEEPSAARPS